MLTPKLSMATLPTPPDDLTPEQLYLGHLELIERVVAHACRRCPFSREEAEDFKQHVHVKLIENDYARIRQFRGRSSFKTYLTTVIGHLLQDYQNSAWGKWRPSAEAERLGEVAMLLERLTVRDERPFEEACQVLRLHHRVEMSTAELADLAAKLPPRNLRHFVGEEGLQAVPAGDPGPDERVEARDIGAMKRRVYAALQRAIAELTAEDRRLIRLWLEMKVADIARLLGVAQKPLYRKIEKILAKLKKELERQGIRRQGIEEVLGALGAPDLDF
jgi:RNA polymerase sigma factor (sigma-70 family)